MSLYAVIMAGGRGERLYPLSTPELPKQFLRLFGDRTMLQHTVDRIQPLVRLDHTLVVVGNSHADIVRKQLPELPDENVLTEPMGRGTAACVALSALLVRKRDPNAVLIVLPADHRIEHVERFRQLLRAAVHVASDRTRLVTFGIAPDRPETGYGYIFAPRRVPGLSDDASVFSVERFVEKPDLQTAESYVAAGTYFWNSGMFVWHVDAILDAVDRYMTHLSDALAGLMKCVDSPAFDERFRETYKALEPQSVDRGVMEKSDRVLLVPAGDIGWSDVGSWEALRRILQRVDKPWGHERLWALNQHYVGKFLHIRAGESLSLQYHELKDETICVLGGRLHLTIGRGVTALENKVLGPGDCEAIPPGTIHQMKAIEDTVVVEVSTPQLADVVRIEDRYGRV
jgi:mannose-1-phosphate guanylyltransferase